MNKCIRAVFNLKNRDNTITIMKENNIMSLTQICAYTSLLLIKKMKHGNHCNPRVRQLIQDKEVNDRRNGKLNHVIIPYYRLKILQNQCPYICPKLYNELPHYLRLETATIRVYKEEIKKLLN